MGRNEPGCARTVFRTEHDFGAPLRRGVRLREHARVSGRRGPVRQRHITVPYGTLNRRAQVPGIDIDDLHSVLAPRSFLHWRMIKVVIKEVRRVVAQPLHA